MEGYDKDWTSFSSINEASYTGVPAGDYIFKVRYKRDVFDTEYRHFSIPVYILSPWYRSVAAYFVYLIIFLLLLGYVIYLLRKNYASGTDDENTDGDRKLPEIRDCIYKP